MKVRPNSEKIEVEKLELEKRYQEIIEENKRKTAATKKAAAQAESEDAEAQAKNEIGAADAKK